MSGSSIFTEDGEKSRRAYGTAEERDAAVRGQLHVVRCSAMLVGPNDAAAKCGVGSEIRQSGGWNSVTMFEFRIDRHDGSTHARRGVVTTPHGSFDTPAFMPVGTRGSVKGLLPEMVAEAGSQIILANTYHMFVRPGPEIVAEAGGLHRFINWPGPILTDSGGFQVFSLSELRKMDDSGVVFASHKDGALLRLDAETSIGIQEALGADIIMAFDECPPWPCTEKQSEDANRRTIAWAERCKKAHRRSDQALFAIVQGSMFPAHRQACMEALVAMDFPGYALGGLSVGEEPAVRNRILRQFAHRLPVEKPRYLMGVGRPVDIITAVECGIDMFDCVMPTRNGRNGFAFTSGGPVKLRNEQYKRDFGPLDSACGCVACRGYSRAYLRHLFLVGEMLGPILVSLHNVAFFQNFMREIRQAICENSLIALKERTYRVWNEPPDTSASLMD